MPTHRLPRLLTTLAVALLVRHDAAWAGNHVEVTWLPTPPVKIGPDIDAIKIKLPYDRFGPVRQALFLRTRIPPVPPPLDTQPSTQASQPSPPERIVLALTSNGQALPAWIVTPRWSSYVVSLKTIRDNPGYAHGELWLDVQMDRPWNLTVSAIGSPDLLLASTERDGPFDDYVAAIPPGDVRDYFNALQHHQAGRINEATEAYRALAAAPDARVARLARRGLRMVAVQTRRLTAPTDFETRRKQIMYLQQCGFFPLAMVEASGPLGPFNTASADTWHRISEVLERLGGPITSVADHAERAGLAANVSNPTDWRTLVVILNEERVERQRDGQTVTETVRLTREQVERIYRDWHTVEQFVFGASNGMLRINTEFLWIQDTSVQPYTTHAGWLYGPTDDLFPVRGSYDSVISIRPTGPSVTGGPDCGPNGAALTDLGPDRGWEVMLHEWNHQFDWATIAAEVGPGYPVTHDSDGCGVRPIPSMGFGHRSSMRYYMTPAMYRNTLIAAPAVPGAYVREWNVEGPYEINDPVSPGQAPRKHVLDPFPPGGVEPLPARTITSSTDFVDLFRELGHVRAGVARVSCWVFSPADENIALWLGHNDGMAVWLNKRLVHRGDYYAQARWEDKNLTDMVMAHAEFTRGWNHLEAIVEAWPAPREKGWGFSLRFAGRDNQTPVGLITRTTPPIEEQPVPDYVPPKSGPHYEWARTFPDFQSWLPRLSDADLERITGVAGLSARGAIDPQDPTSGYVAVGVADAPEAPRRRTLPLRWDREKDQDVVLNNVLDWNREDVAAFPYQRDGAWRALLVLRPEAVTPYLTLLRETPEASTAFAGKRPDQRMLGWLYVPPGSSARALPVVDVMLGDPADWPLDEEDLLEMPVSTPSTQPAHTDPQPASSQP